MKSTVYKNPSDALVRQVLSKMRTLVVVGLSPDPTRPSYHVCDELLNNRIAKAQREYPLRIIPVRPVSKSKPMSIFNFPAKNSLLDIDEEILTSSSTIIDIFRNPKDVPGILDQLKNIVPKEKKLSLNVVLQEGIVLDEECHELAVKWNWFVMQDVCVKKEHQRLLPEQWITDTSAHAGNSKL